MSQAKYMINVTCKRCKVLHKQKIQEKDPKCFPNKISCMSMKNLSISKQYVMNNVILDQRRGHGIFDSQLKLENGSNLVMKPNRAFPH